MMERLTERYALERWTSESETPELVEYVAVRGKALGRAYFESDKDYEDYSDALDRLAAYEDTELTPEQIKEANHLIASAFDLCCKHSPDTLLRRLKDILVAEAEGRLVVVPCKVGDTVYIVDRGKILEEEVLGFSTFNTKSGETVTAMTASYGYYVTRPNINDLGVLHSGNRLSFFFTREEAEKALKGVSDDA